MKVISYLASLPKRQQQNSQKSETLLRFARGVTESGDQGIVSQEQRYEPCDVAVILGWVHEHGKDAPHLRFRREILDQQQARGGRTVVADSNLFLYRDTTNPGYYLRYSFDGIFPNTGEYCDQWSSDWRWQDIQRDLGVALRDWRVTGNHVLVCLQRNGGWSMANMQVEAWAQETLTRLRQHTDRPIRIRAHPGDRNVNTYLPNILRWAQRTLPGSITASAPNTTFMQDLKHAWAMVNHNSSPAVGAVIEGIPAFVTDPVHSQARDVANTDLANIESPLELDRRAWVCRISQSHWSHRDLESGRCWEHMRQWVQA